MAGSPSIPNSERCTEAVGFGRWAPRPCPEQARVNLPNAAASVPRSIRNRERADQASFTAHLPPETVDFAGSYAIRRNRGEPSQVAREW